MTPPSFLILAIICFLYSITPLVAQTPDYVGVSGQTSVESSISWRRTFVYEVTFSHQNIGQALGTSGTMRIRYELVPDGGGAPIRLQWRLSPTNSTQTQDRQVGAPGGVNFPVETRSYLLVPSNLAFGNYNLRVLIDSDDAWDESNENNNTFTLSNNITVIRTPDLAFRSGTGVTISGSNVVRGAGESFTLNFTLTNEGDLVGIPAFLVQYYLVRFNLSGSVEETISLGIRTASALTVNQQIAAGFQGVTMSEQFNLPAGLEHLNYRFRVELDPFDTVTEYSDNGGDATNIKNSNEDEDITVREVLERPDYVAGSSFENTFSPLSSPAGEFVTFNGRVENTTSFASANATTVRITMTSNAGSGVEYDVGLAGIPPIVANSSRNFSANLRVPSFLPPGDYRYIFYIDDAEVVAEQVETNNKGFNFNENLQVTAPVLPDLATTGAGQFAPASAEPGDQITIQAPFENVGASSASNFRISFYLSTNSTVIGDGADILIGFRTITASISAGGSASSQPTLTLPASIPAGDYYVGWKLDSLNAIEELSEGNNTHAVTPNRLTIVPPGPTTFADLVPTAAEGVKEVALPGDEVTLSVDITNRGDATSPASQCRIYLAFDDDPNGPGVLDLGMVSVPALAPDDIKSVGGNFTLPKPDPTIFGDYRILAVVDSAGGIQESNELNNTRLFDDARVTIGSEDPDDYASVQLQQPSLTPGIVPTESLVELLANVTSEGDGLIGGLRLKVYLSANGSISPSNDTLLYTSEVLDFSAENSAVLSRSIRLPDSVLPGSYQVLWQLDGLQNLYRIDPGEPQRTTSLVVRDPILSVKVLAVGKNESLVQVSESSGKLSYLLESSVDLFKWNPASQEFEGDPDRPIIFEVDHTEDEHRLFRYFRVIESQ